MAVSITCFTDTVTFEAPPDMDNARRYEHDAEPALPDGIDRDPASEASKLVPLIGEKDLDGENPCEIIHAWKHVMDRK